MGSITKERAPALAQPKLSSSEGHSNLSLTEETVPNLLLHSSVILSQLFNLSELPHIGSTCPVYSSGAVQTARWSPNVWGW